MVRISFWFVELSKPQEFCMLYERPQSIVKSTAIYAIVVQYIHLYQGNINCGASSQTDFLTFWIIALQIYSQISSNISQNLHFLPAQLAGWNNKCQPAWWPSRWGLWSDLYKSQRAGRSCPSLTEIVHRWSSQFEIIVKIVIGVKIVLVVKIVASVTIVKMLIRVPPGGRMAHSPTRASGSQSRRAGPGQCANRWEITPTFSILITTAFTNSAITIIITTTITTTTTTTTLYPSSSSLQQPPVSNRPRC